MNAQEKINFLNNLGFTPVSENLADNLEVKCNKCGEIFKREFSNFKSGITLEIFDEKLTEAENMEINGYVRIWDCGQSVWVYSPKV